MSYAKVWRRRPWQNPAAVDARSGVIVGLIGDWREYGCSDDAWLQYFRCRRAGKDVQLIERRRERQTVLDLYRLGVVELEVGRCCCRFTPEGFAHPDVVEALWMGGARTS